MTTDRPTPAARRAILAALDGHARPPTRPLVRYFGGKWILAPWIITHFPAHRIYVEPFGGAASVLLRKTPAPSEIYNDLNEDVVNLFRVLRDPDQSQALLQALHLTPFSRDEFEAAYRGSRDPVERARQFMIRSWMGHGSNGVTRKTGYRTNVVAVTRTSCAGDWKTAVDHLPIIIDRLRGVNIEHRSAVEVIRGHDAFDTLIYCDPPYITDTRSSSERYRYEMTDQNHQDLADVLHNVKGMALVSGYESPLYDELYADWLRVERDHYTESANRDRTEILWLSPSTTAALEREGDIAAGVEQLPLWAVTR